MATLLLCIAGPMQSWGTRSRFDERDTDLEPSKSGVLGLVCAVLGRDRTEPIDDLAQIQMGVRVDRQGVLRVDYQTAQPHWYEGKSDTEVTRRYYLADAVFLVGLAGDDRGLLEEIHEALRHPRWPLYLGRKSYVPSRPVWLEDGLRPERLEDALARYPALIDPPPTRYRYVLEAGEGSLRMDQPIASFAERRFGARYVFPVTCPPGDVPSVPGEAAGLSVGGPR